MKHLTVRNDADLKEFIATVLGISKGKAKELIDARTVFVNHQRVWIATHRLHRGDEVELVGAPAPARPESRPIAVLYEDEHIVAVNKPPSIVSDGSPDSIEAVLRRTRKEPDIQAIHRLDRDTTGVFLLARNSAVFGRYKALWRDGQITKVYLALTARAMKFLHSTVDAPIDGKSAVSHVSRIHTAPGFSYLQVRTTTGRKHQVRLHLGSIGHPVLGDKQHGPSVIRDLQLRDIPRQMLHCSEIVLPSLKAPERITIAAPLPEDFRRIAIRLGLLSSNARAPVRKPPPARRGARTPQRAGAPRRRPRPA